MRREGVRLQAMGDNDPWCILKNHSLNFSDPTAHVPVQDPSPFEKRSAPKLAAQVMAELLPPERHLKTAEAQSVQGNAENPNFSLHCLAFFAVMFFLNFFA